MIGTATYFVYENTHHEPAKYREEISEKEQKGDLVWDIEDVLERPS